MKLKLEKLALYNKTTIWKHYDILWSCCPWKWESYYEDILNKWSYFLIYDDDWHEAHIMKCHFLLPKKQPMSKLQDAIKDSIFTEDLKKKIIKEWETIMKQISNINSRIKKLQDDKQNKQDMFDRLDLAFETKDVDIINNYFNK